MNMVVRCNKPRNSGLPYCDEVAITCNPFQPVFDGGYIIPRQNSMLAVHAKAVVVSPAAQYVCHTTEVDALAAVKSEIIFRRRRLVIKSEFGDVFDVAMCS